MTNELLVRIALLEEENQRLKQWDINKDNRNSKQRIENAKLLKENQRLNNVLNELEKKLQSIKFYIEQSDIKNMLWGKEILKIIGGNND